MEYIVLEIQESQQEKVATLITTHTSQEAAESKYHDVLRYAAISSLLTHTAMIIRPDGTVIKSEHYSHYPSTEEEVTNA